MVQTPQACGWAATSPGWKECQERTRKELGTYLIATLPPGAHIRPRQIAKEIGKSLKVGRCRRVDKNSRLVAVELESAECAKWFCLQKNGRLEVAGHQLRIDTLGTRSCVWETEEGPSPQRPGSRPPSVSTEGLRDIYGQYRQLSMLTLLGYDPTVPPPALQPTEEGLQLAPPYHLLPDTPFFRSARIVPPPIYCNDGLPTLQRITNRYLASIQLDDDRDEDYVEQWAAEVGDQMTNNSMDQMEEGHLYSNPDSNGTEALRIALGWSSWNGYATRRNPPPC